MTTQHTPGPWVISKTKTDKQRFVHSKGTKTDYGRAIVTVIKFDDDDTDFEGNARLISLVPELLETCEIALSHIQWGNSTKAIKALTRIINKANGGKYEKTPRSY